MLLRCYTQNIDGLEVEAGVESKRVVYAHGSLQWAACSKCNHKVNRYELEPDVWAGRIARCAMQRPARTLSPGAYSVTPVRSSQRFRGGEAIGRPASKVLLKPTMRTRKAFYRENTCGGILKPGVTFFGESLDKQVGRSLEIDHDKVDALIVIGTSLSV